MGMNSEMQHINHKSLTESVTGFETAQNIRLLVALVAFLSYVYLLGSKTGIA